MYSKASNNIINVTEQMKLDVVLTKGAKSFHPDTAEEMLIHLMQVRR